MKSAYEIAAEATKRLHEAETAQQRDFIKLKERVDLLDKVLWKVITILTPEQQRQLDEFKKSMHSTNR